jgi:hypothetical protein
MFAMLYVLEVGATMSLVSLTDPAMKVSSSICNGIMCLLSHWVAAGRDIMLWTRTETQVNTNVGLACLTRL